MAEKKITELTEHTGVMDVDDIMAMVDDPGGTPATKKVKKRNVMTRYIMLEPFHMQSEQVCATGDGKSYFHVPPDLNGLDLVYCHAEVKNTGTTGTMQIQIRNVTQSVDMLSTKLQIDSGESGSDTAATAYDINESNDQVSTNDIIALDFDQLHSTPADGCIVTLGFG